jgi:alcohol dehydrogenase class IV
MNTTVPRAAMRPPVVAEGASDRLSETVADLGGHRVLVVASARARRIPAVRALGRGRTRSFTAFQSNPTIENALAGAAVVAEYRPDVIVAVGGGSAIDTAKLARALPVDLAAACRILQGTSAFPAGRANIPLIAVPTTAGAGSEVTRFATVYVNGVKHSLDHPSVLPDRALVDPRLLTSCPVPLRYACAFDALCHAVESYWSLRATPVSRRLAMDALHQLLPIIARGPADPATDSLTRLASAATTAGQAIDITRTTAAHAFAYHLTARFSIPHGVACLLNLLWLIEHNMQASSGQSTGAAVREVTAVIPSRTELRELLHAGGYPARLSGYGIGLQHVPSIVSAGMASARAGNNPVELVATDVERRIRELL